MPVLTPPLDHLLPATQPSVRAVARRHRLAPADADDLVQDTWLTALEHLDALEDPDALAGWVAAIAHRKALRLHGRRRRELPVDAVPERQDPDGPGPALELAELQRAVRRAVGDLPARQRRLLQGMLQDPAASYSQLADRLDMPVGAIGPTRGRALRRLHDDRRLRALRAD